MAFARGCQPGGASAGLSVEPGHRHGFEAGQHDVMNSAIAA
jgi:hypothetical protein